MRTSSTINMQGNRDIKHGVYNKPYRWIPRSARRSLRGAEETPASVYHTFSASTGLSFFHRGTCLFSPIRQRFEDLGVRARQRVPHLLDQHRLVVLPPLHLPRLWQV
jgi:hypothetical protein